MIPITVVKLDEEVERLAVEVIRSGMLAQGPMVQRFEREFADLIGVKHAIAVNNGTTALVAPLQALDLRPGDEVITSPFTFAATLNAILESGATARFADIRPEDFNVDPAAMAAKINDRTKVLLPVHLYGQPADMEAIAPLATERGLHLIEDTAQSHGATINGKCAGSFGIGTFSFYATKNIAMGEGGMVTTNDDALNAKLRILRHQGMGAQYDYVMPGHNYRLTDLQAALAIPQLAAYDETVKRRKANAARLSEGLADVRGVVVPAELPGRSHVWHQYTILLTEEAAVSRDEAVTKLRESGVGCGVYYPKLVFDYDCYRSHPNVVIDEVPVATQIVSSCLSLPVHSHLTDEQLSTIVETVRTVVGG